MAEEKKNGHDESGVTEQLVPKATDGVAAETIKNGSSKKVIRSQSMKKFVDEVKVVEGPKGIGYNTIHKVGRVVCAGIGVIVTIALTNIISILMLIVGAIYINDCTVQPNIPIYLIVSAVFALVEGILNTFVAILARLHSNAQAKIEWQGGEPPQTKFGRMHAKLVPVQRIVRSIFGIFGFCWLIVGSVWVYSVYGGLVTADPKDAAAAAHYCHACPYYFTFVLITITWILVFLAIPCCCCLFCLAICRAAGDKKAPKAEPSPDAAAPVDEEKGAIVEKEVVELETKKDIKDIEEGH